MAQRKHLDDFLRGRYIGRLECGRTQPVYLVLKYPRNLESPRVSSPGFGNDSKMMVMCFPVEPSVSKRCLQMLQHSSPPSYNAE
ncbi:hypothetical protein TNCV_3628941 [Trichonephila clavipes]|nr:hypothetical protein TNCV_3628941 [Trichonephila clavipes]